MKRNVFVASGARTPIGSFNGVFSELTAPQLGGVVIKSAIQRAKARLADVDEVIMGNVLSAGLGQNAARQAALNAGLPVSCGATTVNKMCGSAMCAVRMASQAIQCGDAEVVIAGGMENMTRAPYLLSKARGGYRLGNGELIDTLLHDGLLDASSHVHMGNCAEVCAREYHISREEQDEYAIESYRRWHGANAGGRFKDEIAPVEIEGRNGKTIIMSDEEPAKFEESKLYSLKPAFELDGTITAGNASSLSDGAAAILLASDERAKALGLRQEARILGYANVAVDPKRFTVAPIHALGKLFERLSLKPSQVDLFEINEAFSVVVLAAMKELSLPHAKVNVFGGAVALGHPIGASGARIIVTLMNALRVRKGRIGVATICIGGGEAIAIAIERYDG